MTDVDEQILRRHFVAIATSKYDHPTYPELTGVGAEVGLMLGWFTSKEKLGNRRFTQEHENLADNPRYTDIEAVLRDPPSADRWGSADAAVVYITGHGDLNRDGAHLKHYLVLQGTEKRRLAGTGFPTAQLFEWLADTDIEYLLVIIDVCFAGQLLEQVDALAKDHWLILPSATREQRARMGALTEAITRFVEKGAAYNTNSPYLPVGVFVSAVNDVLPRTQKIKHIYKGTPRSDGQPNDAAGRDEHVCLPNPHYKPEHALVKTTPAVRDLALREAILGLHNRVTGGPPTEDHPGWFFTCRAALMRDLKDAVRRPGLTLVTGSVGSGKSTALSRLVTLSDPGFRAEYAGELTGVPGELLPPPGCVDVAVSARKQTDLELVTFLCHHLLGSLPKASPGEDQVKAAVEALTEYLADGTAPVAVIVDAVDEAETPSSLVRNVLVPLAEEAGRLCLLIGVRSPRGDDAPAGGTADEPLRGLMAGTPSAHRIRVDTQPWWNQDDITTFVRNILVNTAGSPYRDAEDSLVAGVTDAILRVARSSYLVAEVAASSLAGREAVIALDDPRWRADLKDGLVGVLRGDLHVNLPDPEPRRRSLVLLRAVAFARGGGLPWKHVWPRLANAVNVGDGRTSTYGDDAVAGLLGSRLNAYLATSQEDDLTVYRLMLDVLRSTLQFRWRELLTEEAGPQDGREEAPRQASEDEIAATEARIAAELRPSVTLSVDLDEVPPAYVRRHLAEHALAGGVLDDEHVPIAFLPYLDAARLRVAIAASPARRQLEADMPWLRVVRQVTHGWDWNRPARNAAAIEMWAALNGITLRGSARALGPVGGYWRVPWAVRPPGSGTVLGKHTAIALAAATADLSGVPVAVTGDDRGQLYVWDLSTGTRYRDHEPVDTGGGAVRSIAITQLPDGSIVAATGSADGAVRVWDLLSGRQAGGALDGSGEAIEAVTACALPDGRVVVAAADTSGTVRAWDLVSRQGVGVPVSCGPGQAIGLATARVGDRVLGLATGQDSGLQLWDLATGVPVHDRFTSHPLARRQPGTRTVQGGRAIAAAVLAGREVAITGNGDGLLLWDLRDPAPMGRRLAGSDGLIRSLAAVQLTAGRAMAVTGGSWGVQVWDLSADEPLGELLAGHDGSVEAVALLRSPDGSATAVSASRDKSIRAYDVPGEALAARPSSQQIGVVEAVAAARTPLGQVVAVTAGDTGIQVWDLAAGGLPVQLSGHGSPVVSVSVAELPAGVLVVAGHLDGWISTYWADGSPVSSAELGDFWTAASLATVTLANGQVLTLAGGWDGNVRVWDPLAGEEAGQPLPGHHMAAVAAVAGLTVGDRTLVVSGGEDAHVRIRDLDAHRDPDLPAASPPLDVDAGGKVTSLTVGVLADERPCGVVGADDGTVRVLDLRDGTLIGEPWQACPGAVAAVAVGPLGDRRVAVFTGGADSQVQAWDAGSGQPIGEPLPAPGPVRALAFHSGQSSLVVGGTGVAVARPRHGSR